MQPAPTKAPKKRAAPAKPPASAAKKPCVEPAKPKKYAFEPPPSFAEHQVPAAAHTRSIAVIPV